MTGFRTRFAPSPTGYLHLGHVASACHARDSAGQAGAGQGGAFLIRIEDIDPQRCLLVYERALRDDLTWLGFESAAPILRQSDHLSFYRAERERLHAMGLVYRCTCSRAQVQANAPGCAPDGSAVYGGACRGGQVDGESPHVWRLDMKKALDRLGGTVTWTEQDGRVIEGNAAAFGDVVIGRRDNGVSYHLCVTCDDARQGITLVTRGQDLFEATAVHRVLQALLGYPEPLYAHHGLICDETGRKLSKRNGAESLRALREKGMSPREIIALARASIGA